jgi:hypothetical protein
MMVVMPPINPEMAVVMVVVPADDDDAAVVMVMVMTIPRHAQPIGVLARLCA